MWCWSALRQRAGIKPVNAARTPELESARDRSTILGACLPCGPRPGSRGMRKPAGTLRASSPQTVRQLDQPDLFLRARNRPKFSASDPPILYEYECVGECRIGWRPRFVVLARGIDRVRHSS